VGYDVSALRNLPKHLDYYFFLIGDVRIRTRVNDFFREEFDVIASRLGDDAGIIRQTRKSKIEDELNEAIGKHQFRGTVVSNFLDSVSSQYPGLLILKTHPDHLTEKDTIIHIPFTTLDEVYKNNEELLMDLIGFTKGNQALVYKINVWVQRTKKTVSGLSVGINVGFFSINYQL
jgi:hypothetical protein